MIARVAGTLAIATAVVAWSVGEQATAASPLQISLSAQGFTWQDQAGEASYHVSGSITYWAPMLCSAEGRVPPNDENVPFDATLPADTVSFIVPGPHDPSLTFRKQTLFNIEALDAGGNVIVRDGFASVADPFCLADEIVAAGTGAGDSGSKALPWLTALVAFGCASVAGGLLLKRRAG